MKSIALAAIAAIAMGCKEPARPAPRAEPVVTCMVYRGCGCVEGCAGTSVSRDELYVGVRVPIVAGVACGDTARIETAMGADGHITHVLATTERCTSGCGFSMLRPVNAAQCEGQCDRCEPPRR